MILKNAEKYRLSYKILEIMNNFSAKLPPVLRNHWLKKFETKLILSIRVSSSVNRQHIQIYKYGQQVNFKKIYLQCNPLCRHLKLTYKTLYFQDILPNALVSADDINTWVSREII